MSLANKLVEQAKQHNGRLIIAFDFDDTVKPYRGGMTPIIRRTLKVLKKAQAQGHILMCFTCRSDETEVARYCHQEGISYDFFNESPIKDERVGFGKPYFNILLDDKAGLSEAVSSLELALTLIEK